MSRMERANRLVAEIEARYCAEAAQDGQEPVFRPGAAGWYALRVAPQREDQAEAWLRLRGVYAFHPVLARKVRRFGRVREYQRRYLPGYVFARVPGDPLVHAITASPFITGALCRANGEWGVLDPRKLRAIHAMRNVDAEAEAVRQAEVARRRRAAMLNRGDLAMFRSGPLTEFRCEVVTLRADGGALVRFRLFGREVTAEAARGDLVPLRKSG